MPRNGSGTYSLPQPPFTTGTVISSAAMNSDLSDIATALTGSLPRNGEAGMTGQLKVPDGSSSAPTYSFSNENNTGLSRPAAGQIGVQILGTQIGLFDANGWEGPVKAGVPVGTIVDFAGSAAPTYWYLCYGQAVSRTTYATLFAALGVTYGSGDGVTTFNLPDLRGNATIGKTNMGGSASTNLTTTYFGSDPTVLGNVGGAQSTSVTLQTSNLPAYTPAGSISSVLGGSFTYGLNPGGATPSVMYGGTSSGSQAGLISVSSYFLGTAQGGTSTAIVNSRVAPAFIVNKIIYAGA